MKLNIKWISPKIKPEEGQLIVVAWRRSKNHVIRSDVRFYKEFRKDGKRSKYPWKITQGEICGWIPYPDEESKSDIISIPSNADSE